MVFVFTLIGLVLIGFVTYGFAVVNKMPTKVEGPTREGEINRLTDALNVKIMELGYNYKKAKKDIEKDEKKITALKTDTTLAYDSLLNEYHEEVKKVTAPPTTKNPVRAFWNKVMYGGALASLTCCFGTGLTAVSADGEEPQKLVSTSELWNADNIPMPHLEDETQYVANPDKVLGRTTVDSMNIILRKMDVDLNIETAFVIVNHCEGGEAQRLALDMGNKYGVGRNDRGLVVVMAYGDHDINISPGYDLESTLTDARCGRLLDQFAVPYLKKNQPDSAMLYLTRALYESLTKQDELSPVYEKPMTEEDLDLGIVSFGTMGLLGMMGLLRRRLNKKGLLEENSTLLKTPMSNPTIPLIRNISSGGSSYGSSRSSGRSYRSSSSSSSSRRGSYGGGGFGGGGASRRW